MFMEKIYQPFVIDRANEIVQILIEDGFFVEYEIENYDYAIRHLKDKLTEKFIIGNLDDEEGVFTEDEFEIILKEIAAGSVLEELKKKGLINSYEDENTEETFFLTEEGKEYLKNNKD